MNQPESRSVSSSVIDAAIAWSERQSYLSHPGVREYRGTENGDSPEAWQRDYVAALCEVILTASRSEIEKPTRGARALQLLAVLVGEWDEAQSKRTQSIADEPWHIQQARKIL